MTGFLALLTVLLIVGYPIHGAVMYGDPWTWIFKKEPTDDRRD